MKLFTFLMDVNVAGYFSIGLWYWSAKW